ncbi:MAG: hypothetical protein J1E85_09950 [Ruminococcus sp.]|nr:hypothetical protein [Ruminococcus sp.]
MRATKYKYYRSEETIVKNNAKHSSQKKTRKKLKVFSFAVASVLVASALIIPTTTLAPGVDAFEDSKAASYSIGNLDDFSAVIAENCVPATTAPATEDTTKNVENTTNKAEETEPEVTEEVTEKITEAATEEFTETENYETYDVQSSETEDSESSQYFDSENSNYDNTNNNTYVEESNNYESSGSYLISISNPDYSYSPRPVSLSEYDRAKLERLVMGEAGSIGFNGCALVAQAIRDAMNRSNTTSIDTIISTYQYYAPTNKEPNQDVKNAVSYIFDQNGSAVQHRVLVFYTGTSSWHETQIYLTTCGNVRFFDMR